MTIAVIAVIGVFFAGMGCYALAAPTAIIRPFGITLGSAAARSEVRAVYGGCLLYTSPSPRDRS